MFKKAWLEDQNGTESYQTMLDEDEEEDWLGMATLNFKSKNAYKKWVSYGHIHHVFKRCPTTRVTIRGHKHKVTHSDRCKRRWNKWKILGTKEQHWNMQRHTEELGA